MTTAPARPSPTTPHGDGPDPSGPPTLEQLLILIARAERKGGLDYAEGARLRAGLRHLAGQHSGDVKQDTSVEELRRKYRLAYKRAWNWKQRAVAATGDGNGSSSAGDEDARDALRRVVELATRWTHIPGKRQAGASVLATIRNVDAE